MTSKPAFHIGQYMSPNYDHIVHNTKWKDGTYATENQSFYFTSYSQQMLDKYRDLKAMHPEAEVYMEPKETGLKATVVCSALPRERV